MIIGGSGLVYHGANPLASHIENGQRDVRRFRDVELDLRSWVPAAMLLTSSATSDS